VSGTSLAERAARAGLRRPRTLTLAITGACNLRCRHCWVDAGTRTSAGHVPVAKLLGLVDGFVALGVDTIWITGGEPLGHPEWPAILSHCCAQPSLGAVGLQTNGGLLDDARVACLRALPTDKLHLQVSLDGASPRTHDRVRGRGGWAATVAGTARLAAAGLGGRTAVAFTEMRHNMDDFPELLALVDRLQLRGVVAGTLVQDGRAARTALEPPTPAQYRALLARYHGDARFRDLYERYGRCSAVEWWKGRSGERGDPCDFFHHPSVSADGELYPCKLCHADEFTVSGVFERPLDAVLEEAIPKWHRLLELARARPASSPECQGCAVKLHCAGGCMGRALATRGSLTATEDRCELRHAVHLWDLGDAGATFEAPEHADGSVAGLPSQEQARSMDIHELLAEDRTLIVEEAWRSSVRLRHYQRDGEEATRQRLELLFDHVARAIRMRDLGELLDYSEQIAKQRFDAGFDLSEVQTAFFMLEDAIGRRALARLPPADLAEALGLVGTAIRRGMDAFARGYISLANRARAPSLDLSDLFKGK
jgi:radical SAM protein with 4Fe4S-binding SPASM domain